MRVHQDRLAILEEKKESLKPLLPQINDTDGSSLIATFRFPEPLVPSLGRLDSSISQLC